MVPYGCHWVGQGQSKGGGPDMTKVKKNGKIRTGDVSAVKPLVCPKSLTATDVIWGVTQYEAMVALVVMKDDDGPVLKGRGYVGQKISRRRVSRGRGQVWINFIVLETGRKKGVQEGVLYSVVGKVSREEE